MRNYKTELLSCPFCGNSELSQFAIKAALDVAYVVNCKWCGGRAEAWTEEAAVAQWNTRTPAEDVRAVGEEPVAAQWRYRNALVQGGIGPKNFGPWAELPLHRFNPSLTGYIDSMGYECETRALYLRTQGKHTVIPDRHEDRCDSSEAEAYQNGWNACLDEFERLNK